MAVTSPVETGGSGNAGGVGHPDAAPEEDGEIQRAGTKMIKLCA